VPVCCLAIVIVLAVALTLTVIIIVVGVGVYLRRYRSDNAIIYCFYSPELFLVGNIRNSHHSYALRDGTHSAECHCTPKISQEQEFQRVPNRQTK